MSNESKLIAVRPDRAVNSKALAERIDELRPGSIFRLNGDEYMAVASPKDSEDVVVYARLHTGESYYLGEISLLATEHGMPAFALLRDGPKA